MMTHPVQSLYTHKAKLYEFFFIGLLKWGKVLEIFFRENAYLRPGMKILDAGCGTGSVTRVIYELARRQVYEGITFHAFDITPAMLDIFQQWMRREGVQDIQLQQADVLDLENQLPQGWANYDLIVSSAMLEYIPIGKLSQALGSLRKLLNHDGRLLVIVTKRTRLTTWTGAKWWGTNLFDREELERELRQAGFTTTQKKALPASWDSFMMAVEAETA